MLDNDVAVMKELTFDSSHILPDYNGPCGRLHGHTYRLQVGVKGPVRSDGMVVDYKDLKGCMMTRVHDLLDHRHLNDIVTHNFPYRMPTAENMVLWIRNVMQADLGDRLCLVRLWETPSSCAEWRA